MLTRYRLRRLGFAGDVYLQAAGALQRSPRLALAMSLLLTLGLTAWGSAGYRWLTPEVPRVLLAEKLYEPPVLQAQIISHVERLVSGDHRVTLGSARQTVALPQVPAGAEIPVTWHWQAEPNAIALKGSTVLRAGKLAQPIRACSRDWLQRVLVVLAAPVEQEAARQLAIRLLDKGSADQVLLGEQWEDGFNAWLGDGQELHQRTQVLLVLPRAAAAAAAATRMASHPGPWAVLVSEDIAGVARAIDFAGSRNVGEVVAPWRVYRQQGQVLVSGGPERQEEAGIEWVHVCPGTFTMCRLPGEDAVADNEKNETVRQWSQREIVEPPRTVVLSAFQMAATETTQQQYGETGALSKVDIAWADARAFCQGRGGNLPTEAQWEYAARGGSRFPWSLGDEVALLIFWLFVLFGRAPRGQTLRASLCMCTIICLIVQ